MSFQRLAGAWLALCIVTTDRATADELPVYKLKVGQELIYHTDLYSAKDNKLEQVGLDTTCHVWVLNETNDGGWRVLFGDSLPDQSGNDKRVVRTKHHLGYGNLHSDGRFDVLVSNSAFFTFDRLPFFPHLPGREKPAVQWERNIDEFTLHYAREANAGQADGLWSFAGVKTSLLDIFHPNKWQANYYFDLSQGLVVKATVNLSTTNGRKFVRNVELRSVQEVDKNTLQKLRAESETLADAARSYYELLGRVESPTDKELAAKAEMTLKSASAKLTVPMLVEKVKEVIRLHDAAVRNSADKAAHRARLVGLPSPQWEAKDLDGKSVALSDFRGKVVVLDFWAASCASCLPALPALDRFVDEFKSEQVVFLAMNVDAGEKSVRPLIDKLGIHCRTILAAGVLPKYAVPCLPTFVILDAEGTVRDVQFGYQLTAHDRASKTIHKLLMEARASTAK
jgi:thiol-disulfide isomerase/thioredoxin